MPEDTPEIVSKTAARQGITPHVTRNVLGWGLAGVIVLFILTYLAFFAG